MPLLGTQKITDDLVATGVNTQQARLFASKMEEAAHVIRGDLATKSDLESFRLGTKSDRDDLRHEFGALRGELEAAVKELRSEIQLVRSELRGEIKEMTNRFTFILVVRIGLAVAVLKLWP